jgi:hypothetical protein
MSLWGTIPENDPAAGSFYLILSETRMEPTYAAEGDYDFGNVRLGETRNGETPFKLAPDDHPDMAIDGTIAAKPSSEIVTVTLRDIPRDGGTSDKPRISAASTIRQPKPDPRDVGQTLTSIAVTYMKATPAANPAIVAGAVSAAWPLPSNLIKYAVTSTMTWSIAPAPTANASADHWGA